MSGLIHQQTNQTLAVKVNKAETFMERFKGLSGKEDMPSHSTLWIPACPSIHTFFMKFSLDVIFTDRKFHVVSVYYAVPPGKIIFGGLRSYHVFELKTSGLLKNYSIQKGDKLNVVR